MVEFVIISSSLSAADAPIKSFGGVLVVEGGLETVVQLAVTSLILVVRTDILLALLLLVLSGDDRSDTEVIVDETLEGFSNEAKISALSRYNEVRDEAAD